MAGTHFGNHTFGAAVRINGQATLPGLPNNEGGTKFLKTDIDGNVIDGEPPSPGDGGLIDITYLELDLALEDGLLIPGRWYRLTDYQTAHLIVEITVDGLETTAEENIGPIEPLLFFAHKTNNYLQNFVYSAITGDRVVYEARGGSPSLPPASVFKGVITRRIVDHRNISAPLDWQIVVWKMAGNYYQTFNYPYSNPGDPDLLEPRYGPSHDVFIGNSEYSTARPVIFMDQAGVINVHVATADHLVIGNIHRSSLNLADIVDVNIRAARMTNLSLVNQGPNFIITPITALNLEGIAGNAGNTFVAAEDTTQVTTYNHSFLYRASNGQQRLIKVDTGTNEVQIVTP